MSVLVAAIGGITTCWLGCLWLAHKIVRATLEDEARAEAREPMTPELARAARLAVSKKRAIVDEERGRWASAYERWRTVEKRDMDEGQRLWSEILRLDGVLTSLANEEAKIPIYDEVKS